MEFKENDIQLMKLMISTITRNDDGIDRLLSCVTAVLNAADTMTSENGDDEPPPTLPC